MASTGEDRARAIVDEAQAQAETSQDLDVHDLLVCWQDDRGSHNTTLVDLFDACAHMNEAELQRLQDDFREYADRDMYDGVEVARED